MTLGLKYRFSQLWQDIAGSIGEKQLVIKIIIDIAANPNHKIFFVNFINSL